MNGLCSSQRNGRYQSPRPPDSRTARSAGTSEADIEDVFDRQFYLDLVNAEYAAELKKPITLADIGQHPRIVVNIEEHLKAHPSRAGAFNHYRPARYFAENIATLTPKLGKPTLDRFEVAFKQLNSLL